MMRCGCENCRYLKVYRGGYWDPDDYECSKVDELDISEEDFIRCWENGETWNNSEDQICPGYEEVEPEPYYEPEWDKYADEKYSE